MKSAGRFFVLLFFLSAGGSLCAQSGAVKEPQGAFPEARFYGDFGKHLEHDIFRPFFSWEGRMGLDSAVYRGGRHTAFFKTEILTVGGKMTQSRINIVGTSYLLEGRYQFSILRKNIHLAGGMAHNSSHLTQDLADLVLREIKRGKRIPQINTGDLNVIFGEIKWQTPLPFKPQIMVRIQPLNFRGLRGGSSFYDLPVYLAFEETLWSGREKMVVVATQHEIGRGGFSDFSARLELFARNQKEGRFQLLVGGSPGSGLHMSTNYPWYKEGFRVGLRLVFDAH